MKMKFTCEESLDEIVWPGMDHFFLFSGLGKGYLSQRISVIWSLGHCFWKISEVNYSVHLVQMTGESLLCLRCIWNETDITTRVYSRVGMND